jgi:GNAT superfamily N-acetyltransferase
MGQRMAHESPRFSHSAFDSERCLKLLHTLTNSEDGLVLVVGDEPIGMLLGLVSEQFFSADRLAQELVVYMLPEHRGGRDVVRMIQAFEAWAVSRGAREIALGVSTEVETERTAALYRRLGFHNSGVTLAKRCT